MSDKRPTSRQLAALAELGRQGVDAVVSEYKGETIVTAFARYLTTGEARHISHGLYDYLRMKAGFIAHFNIHGFRELYADPADLLEARHEFGRFEPHGLYGQVYVYRDGMTSRELWRRLSGLIAAYRDAVMARSQQARREQDLATAATLAARHGLVLNAGTQAAAPAGDGDEAPATPPSDGDAHTTAHAGRSGGGEQG